MQIERLYGAHACDLCRQPSSLGWLYTCKQDEHYGTSHALQTIAGNAQPPSDDDDDEEKQRHLLRSLGLSESIAEQVVNNEYSLEQLDLLVRQKQHLRNVIAGAIRGALPDKGSTSTGDENVLFKRRNNRSAGKELPTPDTTPTKPVPSQHLSSVSTIDQDFINVQHAIRGALFQHSHKSPAQHRLRGWRDSGHECAQISTDSDFYQDNQGIATLASTMTANVITIKRSASTWQQPPCRFQCCHGCRPSFIDRLWVSFEAVFQDEYRPLTSMHASCLPVMDATVVKNLGLRKPLDDSSGAPGSNFSTEAQPSPIDTDMTYGEEATPRLFWSSDEDDTDMEDYHTPLACRTPHESEPTNESVFVDVELGPQNATSPSDALSGTQSLSSTYRTHQSSSSLAPSTSLTGSHTTRDSHKRGTLNQQAPDCGGSPSKRLKRTRQGSQGSASSKGSEVEVAGGVALTEEAVEMHMPDIITQV
ncbi:hypothetical protein LTR50_003725 [Elasticomyces elasticus]|nr:hypothetical protein LTR50_003725 [Elasticomyces elasticus]